MAKPKSMEVSMKYLRYPELVERGIVNNRSTLARMIKQGYFPEPVRLSPGTIAWRSDVVDQWMQERGAA